MAFKPFCSVQIDLRGTKLHHSSFVLVFLKEAIPGLLYDPGGKQQEAEVLLTSHVSPQNRVAGGPSGT